MFGYNSSRSSFSVILAFMWLIQEILCNCNWLYEILVLDFKRCSVLYCTVLYCIEFFCYVFIYGFNGVINRCNNTARNIVMIYESLFERDVKKRSWHWTGIERLRQPPPPHTPVFLPAQIGHRDSRHSLPC